MNRPHSALLDRLIRGEALDTLRRSLVQERDALVREGFERACGEHSDRLQVLAVGGYGRSDLYPHSDTDLVVLYDGEDGDDASAGERLKHAVPGAVSALEAWFRDLNDGPSRATVRVRAIPEHAKHILADLSVGTAALDARTICGAPLLIAPDTFALETLRGAESGGIHAFVSAHVAGYRDRHTRFGGSAHMLEPQLKMGRGGLRDAHTAHWIARAIFEASSLDDLQEAGRITDTDRESFDRAAAFVCHVRFVLHASSKWKNDRLAFKVQPAVARLMGFSAEMERSDVDGFMSTFYHHAESLGRISERWLEEWTSANDRSIALDGGGYDRAGRWWLPEDERPEVLAQVAVCFDEAANAGLPWHPDLVTHIAELADALPADAGLSPAATQLMRRAFLELSATPTRWNSLVHAGLLSALTPEWSHLAGQAVRDVYHVYTTDRHLLETRAAIARASADAPPFIREVWNALPMPKQEIVAVAALLHDVGKGLRGDHSMIGAGLAREVAMRWGMSGHDADTVRWLVLEHLLLARTSQRRDISDPQTLDFVGDHVTSVEQLDMLTVLTWADMTSVGPALRTPWKLRLLQQLYERMTARLAGGEEPMSWLQVLERLLPSERARRRAREAFDDASWAELREDEIRLIAPLLRPDATGVFDTQVAVVTRPQDYSVAVRAPDRNGLLRDLLTALASDGLTVLRARILTTKQHVAIDIFEIDAQHLEHDASVASLLRRAADTLRDAARQTRQFPPVAPGTESRIATGKPQVPTSVIQVDSGARHDRVVIQIKHQKGPKVLSIAAACFTDHGFDIDRAIVTIEGERAIASFYLHGRPYEEDEIDELCEEVAQRLSAEAM